jgi:hypothetical protein
LLATLDIEAKTRGAMGFGVAGREESIIVANASEATVIFLQSHPVWTAARQRECQRREEMRRHPAFLARQRAAALGRDVAADFRACPGADAPA